MRVGGEWLKGEGRRAFLHGLEAEWGVVSGVMSQYS